ncbi:MAG TPA: hemerythrin domain-containing protein [Chitinispirillaceae bacterium]|nr:hemerythrin domain-containing protein [Chitinispirillaceae bacterium]
MADNLFTQLHQEHQNFKMLFEQILDQKNVDAKIDLFNNLKKALIPHMKSEEMVFYPELYNHEDTKEMSLEALEEHHVAEAALMELSKSDPFMENWRPKAKVLSEILNHHIEEEESEIFNAARDIIPQNRQNEIYTQYIQKKDEILKSI